MKGVGAALGEIGAKAVPTDIFHFVFVRERGDGGGGIFSAEGFVEKNKVGEAAADREGGLLEGLEVCLEGSG